MEPVAALGRSQTCSINGTSAINSFIRSARQITACSLNFIIGIPNSALKLTQKAISKLPPARDVASRVSRVAIDAFKTIIFLPQRAYNSVREFFGGLVGKQVLPASSMYSKSKIQRYHEFLLAQNFGNYGGANFVTSEVSLNMSDGVKLNGVQLKSNPSTSPDNERWIVYCQPNCSCWEVGLDTLTRLQRDTKANVVSYNYRGVGYSESLATSDKQLIGDVMEIVQSLIREGVKPEHIQIHGFSLGGGVGTIAATRLVPEGLKVLCCERSFSSLQDEIAALIPFGKFAGKFVAWTGWELNAKACIPSLPEKTIVIYSHEDPVIPHPASFAKAVDEGFPSHAVRLIEMDRDPMNNAHCRPFNRDEQKMYTEWVREALKIDAV